MLNGNDSFPGVLVLDFKHFRLPEQQPSRLLRPLMVNTANSKDAGVIFVSTVKPDRVDQCFVCFVRSLAVFEANTPFSSI
jgi:hypothetical protein